jgi:hypothetical protein
VTTQQTIPPTLPSQTEESATETGGHDLDHLAGTWSHEEATAFEAALKEQRQIPSSQPWDS